MPQNRHPWHWFFDDDALKRGGQYARDDQVEHLTVSHDQTDLVVEGIVHGHWEYHTRLILCRPNCDDEDEIWLSDLQADCDCPAEDPCKHAAAIAILTTEALRDDESPKSLAAGDDPEEDDEPPVVDPPSRRKGAQRLEPPPGLAGLATVKNDRNRSAVDRWLWQWHRHQDDEGEQIRWTLDCRTQAPGCFIGLYRSRRLKTGGWSSGKRSVDLYRFLNQPPLCATPPDLELARILEHSGSGHRQLHPSASIGGWLPLAHAADEILDRLLSTGRFTYQFPSGRPLTAGPPRPADFSWGGHPGARQLVISVGSCQILPVLPWWYLDPATSQLGRVDTPLPVDLQALVSHTPVLADGDLAPLSARLAEVGVDLPPPPDLIVPQTPPPRPIAVFGHGRLSFAEYGWGWSRNQWKRSCRFLVATVGYGGHRLPAVGEAHQATIDGETFRLDPVAERAMAGTLRHLGLMPLSATKADLEPTLPVPETCIWLARDPGLIRLAPDEPADDWDLPVDLPARLTAVGWDLEGVDLPQQVVVEADAVEAVFTPDADGQDWFRLDLGVRLGDERIDLLPALRLLAERGSSGPARTDEPILVPLPDGRLLRAPRAPLERILAHLREILGRDRSGVLRLDVHDADLVDDLASLGATLRDHRALAEAGARLRTLAAGGLPAVTLPKTFTGELRPYQADGLAWMHALRQAGLGGLLADDMGLGKTVMAIALCASEKHSKRLAKGALILAPRSMLGTWQREFARFAPKLDVLVHHGIGRDIDLVHHHDVVVTTYATAVRDIDALAEVPFDLVICDEAQALKNPVTKTAKALPLLTAEWRLALTGTPMENHLGELWSLMHWLNPALLGSLDRFERVFRKPIERDGEVATATRLQRKIAPVLLRRTKEAVAADLPPKTETVITVEMGLKQRELYEGIRVAMDDRVRAAIAGKGLARSGLLVIEALLRLRQVSCHPPLVGTPAALKLTENAKLDMLEEMLPTLIEDGRRILLFTQFTGMFGPIIALLDRLGIAYLDLHGQTRKRQERIDAFQRGEAQVFLISLKAGGTGLTLTAADTVIHFDPWWNPAVEDQATDRAHRIGQTKPVFVYRLIAAGSVEERIRVLQERKRGLIAALYAGDGQAATRFTQAEVDELLRPLD